MTFQNLTKKLNLDISTNFFFKDIYSCKNKMLNNLDKQIKVLKNLLHEITNK